MANFLDVKIRQSLTKSNDTNVSLLNGLLRVDKHTAQAIKSYLAHSC